MDSCHRRGTCKRGGLSVQEKAREGCVQLIRSDEKTQPIPSKVALKSISAISVLSKSIYVREMTEGDKERWGGGKEKIKRMQV